MIDPNRLALEKEVFSKKLPPNMYMFRNIGTEDEHLLIGARTNARNVYTLKIMLILNKMFFVV